MNYAYMNDMEKSIRTANMTKTNKKNTQISVHRSHKLLVGFSLFFILHRPMHRTVLVSNRIGINWKSSTRIAVHLKSGHRHELVFIII